MYNPQQKTSLGKWITSYFRDAKEELGKVTWPSKPEVIKYSLVVITMSVFIAAFFGGLDWLLNLGLEQLIGLIS